MLVTVVANARRPATARDREQAARWLCRPGGPLERFKTEQFVQMNGAVVIDPLAMIG